MTRVTCPDCDNDLSSTAERCPKCGFNMSQHPHNVSILEDQESARQEKEAGERKVGWRMIGVGVVLLVITLFLIPPQTPGTVGRWMHMGFNLIVVIFLMGGVFSVWENRRN